MTSQHPRPPDCADVLAALFPYLDRELSQDEQAAVQWHLDHCAQCAHLFRFEAAFLSLVERRLGQVTAPPALRARLAGMATTMLPDGA